MPRRTLSRSERAEAMRARMPHVPRGMAAAMVAHLVVSDFKCRGVPAAVEAFFARLHHAGRAPVQALEEDFEAVATSRTRLYALLYALETFAPHLPLSAARGPRRRFDKALNAKYNAKPKKSRTSARVASLPEDWPGSWQSALPGFAGRMRLAGGNTLGKLAPKSRDSVIQAVGMCAAARVWAARNDVDLGDGFSPDLVDATARFFLLERKISLRSAADYLERVRMFALRGGLLDETGWEAFSDAISELRLDDADTTPAKVEKVRRFERAFNLGSILIRAHERSMEARRLPGHRARAADLHRAAVVLAALVNGCDRQGDLSRWRIGREIVRTEAGWRPAFRQGKTGNGKDNGCLWPPVNAIIDAHVLGDRPVWRMEERLAELDGMNLLSLAAEPLDTYLASKILRVEFGIGAHLVRTLATDFLRRHRPDAAWAVKMLLGHTSLTMQRAYQTDFREAAAVEKAQATTAALVAAAASAKAKAKRGKRKAPGPAGSFRVQAMSGAR